MKENLNLLVQKAQAGNRLALEKVLLEIQDLVYNLSLKMLLFPEEAQDASQEVLLRLTERLHTFQFKSQFKSWVYRLASNYLLNYTGKKSREFARSFVAYEHLIDSGQSLSVRYAQNEGELALLEEEVKVSCTQGLLLCLNRTDRMVYILAEILEFKSKEGSEILEISPENFRKKLSRARVKIRHFLEKKCGLINPNRPCRCQKKIDFLIEEKIIEPAQLRYAPFTQRSIDLFHQIGELEKSVALYRSVPLLSTPHIILRKIKEAINFE